MNKPNLKPVIQECLAAQLRADDLKFKAKIIENEIADTLKSNKIRPDAFKQAYKLHKLYNDELGKQKQLDLFAQMETCLDNMGYVATFSMEDKA